MRSNTVQRFDSWFGIGVLAVAAILPVIYVQPARGQADMPADHQKHQGHQAANTTKGVLLTDQIVEMRAQIARLQARLDQGHQAGEAGAGMGSMQGKTGMQGMGTMGGKPMMQQSGPMVGMRESGAMSGMGMKGDMKGMKKETMQGSSMQGMGMMGMDGMRMMGRMGKKGMAPSPMTQSALPGFPGSSHMYHLGATGYFLDHSGHITLARDQQTKLNQIKERVLLAQATTDRQIEQAEQELWVLTGADEPDVTKIEAKVREIEKLRGNQRMAFIRAVGEAARVLTDEQRKVLVGEMSPGPQAAASQPAP